MNDIKAIKDVLSIQSESIRESSKYITSSFSKAVRMMLNCKGKIVITGIGKSGFVAQKIAATMVSTGTPAVYLHPVEGMHGNLGLLHKNDILFAIGKSGESEEILNILPAVRHIGAKVICLTANKQSSLAKQSALVLYVPVEKEACPLNLAPTTSSTLALVIGDALAIALMKRRKFKKEHFALYHPGGLLGKRLLTRVSDVMRSGKDNPVVYVDQTMERLILEISKKWTGAANVVDRKGKLVGIVTDFDIRRVFSTGATISKVSIRQIMNSKPIFIYDDDLAVKCFEMMEKRKKPLTVLPVVNRKKKSVGMVHLHDLVSKGLIPPSSS